MWKIIIIEATQRDRFQAKTSVKKEKEKEKKRLAIRDPLESFGIAKHLELIIGPENILLLLFMLFSLLLLLDLILPNCLFHFMILFLRNHFSIYIFFFSKPDNIVGGVSRVWETCFLDLRRYWRNNWIFYFIFKVYKKKRLNKIRSRSGRRERSVKQRRRRILSGSKISSRCIPIPTHYRRSLIISRKMFPMISSRA